MRMVVRDLIAVVGLWLVVIAASYASGYSSGGVPTPVSVLNGGTGATDAATARSNLSAAKSGANTDLTSTNSLTVNATNANAKALTAKGFESQAVNIFDVQNSEGAALLYVSNAGKLVVQYNDVQAGSNLLAGSFGGGGPLGIQCEGATGAIKSLIAGGGIAITEGANGTVGTATLAAGTVDIPTTKAVAGARVFLQRVSGTEADFGHLSYVIDPAVKITVNSTDPQDVSVINWWIEGPSP